MNDPDAGLRLDKWLWYARFLKTRSAASRLCAAGRLRIGGAVISKAHQKIRLGDVLTFPQGSHIRVVKVLAYAARRGSASEARLLYEDLKPLSGQDKPPAGQGPAATGGRPSKRERKTIRRLRDKP